MFKHLQFFIGFVSILAMFSSAYASPVSVILYPISSFHLFNTCWAIMIVSVHCHFFPLLRILWYQLARGNETARWRSFSSINFFFDPNVVIVYNSAYYSPIFLFITIMIFQKISSYISIWLTIGYIYILTSLFKP